jgi:hypothetical protein
MAAPFVAFVLKNGGWALRFFYRKGHDVDAKGTEGDIFIQANINHLRNVAGNSFLPLAPFRLQAYLCIFPQGQIE